MDLEQFREKLGDEMFTELENHVSDLVGQRDAARNESIAGRKGLKEKVSTYEAQISEMLEKLGLESFDDVENLPDVTGTAEANKQQEAKLKRLERQLAEAQEVAKAADGKYRSARKDSLIANALSGHDFVANDVVSTYIDNRLVWEDDDLLFKQDDGKLVAVKDGVAAFAKSRPELVKAQGAGGAGVRSNNARGTEGQQLSMTRAEFEALPPQKRVEVSKQGVTLQ